MSYEHAENMPDWFVPETIFYLWDGEILVGEFHVRHHLTEALRTGSGHIGYSIRRDLRGKGYGTAGLKLTLEKAREIIPEEEVFFRVKKDNIASKRVLEKNRAYVTGEDDEHLFMRIRKQ
ncbi:MAG: GNAT family N-acetyltransferase [Clostridiales bacterium]|nr:GNAT family N-acetyltransferase [Clostridiales bacterium]